MKNIFKCLIGIIMFFLLVLMGYNYFTSQRTLVGDQKIHMNIVKGTALNEEICAMLCYSEGHSGIAKSETFFFHDNVLKESAEQYYLGVSHVFPDNTVTDNFAIPLGFKDGKDMANKLGQIVDYKRFKETEVLILNEWNTENKRFIVAYKTDGDLNTVEFKVTDEAYLGTYFENNKIYVLINLKDYLLVAVVDTLNNVCDTKAVPYTGLVRDRTDLSESYTLIKNEIIYLGEVTYNLEKDEVYSTVSMFNFETEEINSVTFNDEWLFNLSQNGDELVALLGTDKDSRGYYQGINYSILDNKLNVISNNLIHDLPEDIDTVNFSDRSKIHNNKIYTIINGVNLSKSHLVVYDLVTKKVTFCVELVTKMTNKTLFDWNFYLLNNDDYYEIQ